ncbi:MAG TPA: hypothetical protein VF359_02970 [Anaerolineales bacterium]
MNTSFLNGNSTVEHPRLLKTSSGQSETQMYQDEAAPQPAPELAQVHQEKNHVRK